MPKNNPVVEVYNGITIRRSNKFHIRLDNVLYKRLLVLSEETGIPISKILSHSSKPCERCFGTKVMVYTDDGPVEVPRGILFQHMANDNGRSIIKQKNAERK